MSTGPKKSCSVLFWPVCWSLIFFSLALLWSPSAQAQHLSTRIFMELDGLPSNAVFGLTQDQRGEMWFATRRGVARYDGHQWITYDRLQGMPRDYFRRIVTDEVGTVWTATLTTPFSVSYFRDDKWSPLPDPQIEDWGWDLTAFKTHVNQEGTTLLALSSATSITIWDGQQWLSLASCRDFSSISTLEWVGDNLWVATEDGLRAIDLTQDKLIVEPIPGLPPGAVYGITKIPGEEEVDLLGTDWIGTFNQGHFAIVTRELTINLSKVASGVDLLRGPNGGWYFSDQEHLYYYHADLGQQDLAIQNGMASIGATGLVLDRENNVWVGSLRGVTRIGGRSISSYDRQHGLLADEVTSVLQLRSGAMVLGHGNGLTFLTEPKQTLTFPQRPGISSRVIDLTEGPDGRIWVAADRLGLGYLDLQRNMHWVPETRFPQQGTFAVLFDQTDQLWVGGSHGLFRLEGDNFSAVPLPKRAPLLSPFVRRLSLDRDGALLVATGMQGIYRLDGDQIDNWCTRSGLARGTFCAFPRPDGGYFVGTMAGLFRIKDQQIEKSTAPDPVIDRPIFSITAGNQGQIWFGTDVGALRWDGRHLDQFDISDGLLGNETNRDALMLDTNGEMWIGTDHGLSIYRPEFDNTIPGKPLVSLNGFQVDGHPFPSDQSLEVASSVHELVIRFRGVTMWQEENLQFRTLLEPFEKDWRSDRAIPTRQVRYTNLRPGTYTFQLQAIRGDGVVSDIIQSQSITVLRPLWQRWWFICLGCVLALGLFWSILSFWSNRRYTSRLKLAVQTKTAALQESEADFKAESQRLAATLQNISDGVITVSATGTIELVNPTALAIMGLGGEDILGADLDSVLSLTPSPAEDGAETPDHDRARIFTFENPDGQILFLEISTADIGGTDHVPGGKVMVFRDITGRRQMATERLRTQKLESLGILAGGIAHDFNNLLTIMLGNLTLVSHSERLTSLEKHQLDRMKQATKRAQTLANQLLTFAKGGSPQLETARVDELIPMAVSFALSGSSVEYDIEIAPNVSCIRVDPGQFDQVLSNLVINASQSMDGHGKVTITAKDVPNRPEFTVPGPHVMVEVLDRGCGIPEQDLQRIFDPYYTSKNTGSGLGLTTVYSIVNKHDGYLAVESKVGVGTTCRVFLPAHECPPAEKSADHAQTIQGRKKILVLDDEQDVRDILGRMLANLGLTCVCAEEGLEAVATYRKAVADGQPFAAVITDLTIPGGLGGQETIELLLKIDPAVKAIVTSGYSTDDIMAEYAQYGFKGAIRKPFDQDALVEVLAEVLGG